MARLPHLILLSPCVSAHSAVALRHLLAPVISKSGVGTISAMAQATYEAEPAQDAQDAQAPTARSADEQKRLGSLSRNIIPHILKLYNCTATASDFKIYSQDATFEDPLMRARGVPQIKSAFYSIPKVFKEAKVVEYEVEESETSSGTGEISIKNLQHYKIAGREIDMNSLIKLQVENGLVVRHEDLWQGKPLWNKDTIKWPLVGRAASALRRGNMFVTHAFMGFGKDPKPEANN